MTCIAWDGKTLAADKRMSSCGVGITVTKIFRVNDSLVGVSGDGAQGMDMVAWLRDGGNPDNFPIAQRDKDQWAGILVVSSDGLWIYERTPKPMKIEDAYYATGHGRRLRFGRDAPRQVRTRGCRNRLRP